MIFLMLVACGSLARRLLPLAILLDGPALQLIRSCAQAILYVTDIALCAMVMTNRNPHLMVPEKFRLVYLAVIFFVAYVHDIGTIGSLDWLKFPTATAATTATAVETVNATATCVSAYTVTEMTIVIATTPGAAPIDSMTEHLTRLAIVFGTQTFSYTLGTVPTSFIGAI
ncbi:hypothetical protein AOL_s00140g21 [Orbilia oligospora ATCC 24927]|uniref:Uncharacterized protein n=2 Tax=Orbilia oligospora TaxID=2813651 RepID=G1XM52_ARTOA|nr:hypothetical protein AOL_s00140g21 [Orbilia oligospora ATCC 24927]EGX45705.1 hypothetical protein AOL_s00140g21 [Orbilia oligospora ATCC 24927]KAF3272428.1 hypothetical protein TWF970_010054 [Orbilia oligospora]